MKKILICFVLLLITSNCYALFGTRSTIKAAKEDIIDTTQKGLANLNANITTKADEMQNGIVNLKASIGKLETNLNTKIDTAVTLNTKIADDITAKVVAGVDSSMSSKSGRDTNVNDIRIIYILGFIIITLIVDDWGQRRYRRNMTASKEKYKNMYAALKNGGEKDD